ncbi:MAG: tetratricopeptide repeat protein [Deltaproteobacteria bacterium]|jgi:Tfp pilus assembly protein PilF|nr:tetratricopeptide repeat protein [Deltaproteobacteria bacterium]
MGRRLTISLALFALLASLFIAAGCGGGAAARDYQAGSTQQQVVAFTNLGRVLLSQGELAGALVQLSRAEALDPTNPDILTLLGMTYFSRGDYDKALGYLQAALAQDPTKTDVHNNLGLVYMEQNQQELARREFEICLADPTYINSHLPLLNLGRLAEAQGAMDQAESYYRQIVALNPQYPPAYYRIARIYDAGGRTSEAIDYLQNAVRLNPAYVDAFYLLAQTYEKAGRVDEAADAYGQVVNLSPNTPIAIEAQRQARRVLGFD